MSFRKRPQLPGVTPKVPPKVKGKDFKTPEPKMDLEVNVECDGIDGNIQVEGNDSEVRVVKRGGRAKENGRRRVVRAEESAEENGDEAGEKNGNEAREENGSVASEENDSEASVVRRDSKTKPADVKLRRVNTLPAKKNSDSSKVDYIASLKKTRHVPEQQQKPKKLLEDSPQYGQNLKKAEGAVKTEPEYKRLARTKSSGHSGTNGEAKPLNYEELMNLAFKKADDAEERDPALRRGMTKSQSGSTGTAFQGIKIKDDERIDYKTAIKQHVKQEPKFSPKGKDEKPIWAQQKRTIDLKKIGKVEKENTKQDAPWAAQRRGSKKLYELEQPKKVTSQSPEWAHLANKPTSQKLIDLEHKKSTQSSEPSLPPVEWKGKIKDSRETISEVSRVETRGPKGSTKDDQADFRGVLHKGSLQDNAKEKSLTENKQESFEEKDVKKYGWKFATDENENGSKSENGCNILIENHQSLQNGFATTGESGIKRSSLIKNIRRKSSTSRPSLAASLPSKMRRETEDTLMDWSQEVIEVNEAYTFQMRYPFFTPNKDGNIYQDIEINDFTTSWEDGMAFCYLMHFYYPEKINLDKLNPSAKRSNLMLAFQVASENGLAIGVTVDDLMKNKIPEAGKVFDILYDIYCHFHGPLVEWGLVEKDEGVEL